MPHLDLLKIWESLCQFRQIYPGHLAIQTMLLAAWSDREQTEYIKHMEALMPNEIQLNTPTRPRPLTHQLAARGNPSTDASAYPTRSLKPVKAEVLQGFADRIESATGIIVRHPLVQEQGEKS